MDKLFNEKKLMPSNQIMKDKKIAIVGSGAIGSMIAEKLVRGSAGYIAIVDLDSYEANNIPKSSFIIHYPEDIGKPKATALAERLNAVCDSGCSVKGFNMDVKKLGPLAFVGFDYVVAALDSLAIKLYVSELIKQCPKEHRPILLSCGTNGEFTEAMMFSKDGACLRCTIPDSWLAEESPETTYSCAATVNYLRLSKKLPIVSTSGIAGDKSANDIDDMIVGHATRALELKESIRVTQSAYPFKRMSCSTIMPMKNCPVCSIEPPEDISYLPGSTNKTTLRELFESVKPYYNEQFVLKVHTLNYSGHLYNQFIYRDRCRSCGKEFDLMRHSGSVHTNDIICPVCAAAEGYSVKDEENDHVIVAYTFSQKDTPNRVLDMTLDKLGFPVGCYYEFENIVDSDDMFSFPDSKYFALSEDKFFLQHKDQNIFWDSKPLTVELLYLDTGAKVNVSVFPENTLSYIIHKGKEILGIPESVNLISVIVDGNPINNINQSVKALHISEDSIVKIRSI